MADQDFNIKVVTTADTTGLRQTSEELDRLARKSGIGADPATLAARQASLRSALSPVPEELGGAAKTTEKVAEEMEKVGPSALFAGVNIARARQEATFLARELATGVPTTRTLSSLLGALGPYIAGAVGAGFALNRSIVANAERQQKVNEELDIQLTKVTELSQKWTEMAHGVTGPEDMLKLTSSILPVLDQAAAKFREFQNANAVKSAWQDLIDTMTAGIPGVGKQFDLAFEKQANVLAANVQRLREAAIAAARVGEETEKAFDAKKTEPYAQAINELNEDIKRHTELQKQLGIENIESYNAEGRILEQKKAQLQEIQKLQQQSEQKTKKYVETSDPQVQAILKNEKAMFDARAQSRDQDAAMFERTAQGLRRGARPDQLSELDKIYSSPSIVETLKSIDANQRELIQLWR